MLKITAIALGAFIAGALLGYVTSRHLFRISLAPYQMANIDHMATYVMIQRFEGTPQTYETALRDFLVALDAQDRAGPGLFSRNITVVDRAMTYARLGLVAAERNDLGSAASIGLKRRRCARRLAGSPAPRMRLPG